MSEMPGTAESRALAVDVMLSLMGPFSIPVLGRHLKSWRCDIDPEWVVAHGLMHGWITRTGTYDCGSCGKYAVATIDPPTIQEVDDTCTTL